MSEDLSGRAQQYVADLVTEATLQTRAVCLDSGPLIDYIAQQYPVTALLEPILSNPNVAILISTITLAEVVTRPAATGDRGRVDAIHQALLGVPGLRIVDVTQRLAIEAAIVRAGTGLKLPDAAIVATARLAQAGALLGNDRQWRGKALGVPYHHIDDILALA